MGKKNHHSPRGNGHVAADTGDDILSMMGSSKNVQLIAIDQGTTSSRAILFNGELDVLESKQKEFTQHYPQPAWCEHDPMEILESVKECLNGLNVTKKETVAGIGVTNQRETTVAWSKSTGKPFYNAIVWLDKRNQSTVDQLIGSKDPEYKDKYREICGLPVSTYFAGVKMKWMLDNLPIVKKAHDNDDCCFGTIDSWLTYNMTGKKKFVTDISNASRYMLMDLKTKDWSADVLADFGIKRNALPTIVSNCDDFGVVSSEFLPKLAGIPITATIGDQHAALVGQCCFGVGESKNTYGTGCFLITNTGTKLVPSTAGLLTTIGYEMGKNSPTIYALEGSVAIGGRLIQWLRDSLGIFQNASDVETFARKCDSCGDVTLVPAFQGLFAPYWRSDALASLSGMTLQAGKPEICRAALEAVAFQVTDIVNAMAKDGVPVGELRADGGMTANSLLMQIQSDLLDCKVAKANMQESTALGAAISAGISSKVFKNLEEVKEICLSKYGYTYYEPKMESKKREMAMLRWKKAVMKTYDDNNDNDSNSDSYYAKRGDSQPQCALRSCM